MKRGMALMLAATISFQASAQTCNMSHTFDQPDEGNSRPVWEDKVDHSLLFADSLNINTDGTKRSYSVDDFYGSSLDGAYNTLCNAMAGVCHDLDVYLVHSKSLNKPATYAKYAERVAMTKKARDDGWPANELAATRIGSDVISFDATTHKPCVEVDGYLVSMTAYGRSGRGTSCKLADYVDALTIPAVVLPSPTSIKVDGHSKTIPTQFDVEGAGLGDLAVIVREGDPEPHFAVIGDKGPAASLGEVSVAIAKEMLKKTSDPVNRDDILGRKGYPKGGWVVPKSYVLVFSRLPSDPPGFKHPTDIYYNSAAKIKTDAAVAFDKWGGMKRLTECMKVYK